MCTIAETNVFLRAQAELPAGFKVATEEFRDGWNLMRSGGKRRLERKVQTRGWNFIKFADGALRSGVGETSQQAIASALKLALRRVGQHSNAVEVERIELTKYPWFFLARVHVFPYRIQEGAVLPISDDAPVTQLAARQKRLPSDAAVPFPPFGGTMPNLKEMLTAPANAEAGPQ
jgi:hypothetical protein